MKPSQELSPAYFLKECRLFNGLSPGDLELVINLARKRRFRPGEFLFHQGEPAAYFFIVMEGKVKLTQITPEGHQVIIRFVREGGAIGILVALGNMPYPLSAESVHACSVLVWSSEDIGRVMERIPTLALNGMRMLASRFADMMDRYRELATERVERRVARTLLRLTKQTGKKINEGILIDLPLTRRDLAEMTGTTLYTVSRILSRWEQEGHVIAGREKVVIRTPHAMAVIAEDLPSKKVSE